MPTCKKHNLLIVDDVFPSKLSPFRREEITRILEAIPDVQVYATGESLPLLSDKTTLQEEIQQYAEEYPHHSGQIHQWSLQDGIESEGFKLAYVVFLNNIFNLVEELEAKKIPFVFELYPGGGFALNNEESDEKLKRVLQSPYFRKVIVTQDVTYRYLKEKAWCDDRRIENVFGVVTPKEEIENARLARRMGKNSKICVSFCAFKYSPKGEDKGYDTFVEVAKRLHKQSDRFEFCVVGNFGPEDIDVSELGDTIRFMGVLERKSLSDLLFDTDILLAPNRTDVLGDGYFDGFPTTSCVMAALNGALVMATDPLSLNGGRFTSGTNIEIVEQDAESIFQRIMYYFNNEKQFMKVRERQVKRFCAVYGTESQIEPRVNILRQEASMSDLYNVNSEPSRTLIPIMHCFDNNYVIPAAASFHSMLKYADPAHDYLLYVLHTDITFQNQRALEEIVNKFPNATLKFINMENRFEDIWSKLTFSGHFSKEVLYKLLVPSIFPQHEKIIITDVDVVFCGDIAPSYFAIGEDEPVCFAGVRQVCPKGSWLDSYYDNYIRHFGKGSREKLKVCGGYLVANLRAMREKEIEKKFLSYLSENAYRLLQSEQDVINFCTEESDIKYLPLENVACSYLYDIFTTEDACEQDLFYSAEEIKQAMEHPIQLHYATGTKPWKDLLSTKADQWVLYLAESGMYPEYMKKTLASTKESPVRIECNEVGKGWEPNLSPITVSVLCCTYNHEKFIEDTLEGIVKQEVNFPIEIIVADDASTDKTPKIIRKYAKKYPDLFKCILREKNVGIGENYFDALQNVRGKYLAICDGDDQWIDPKKLQRQVDYLESHPGCNVCCTSFVRREHKKDEIVEEKFTVGDYIAGVWQKKDEYFLRDLLYCRFIGSCTTMLRWQFLNRVPEFLRHYKTIDFPLSMLHAASGSIAVLSDEYTAAYNVHSAGITSSKAIYNMQQESLNILREVDQYLDYRFNREILAFIECVKADLKKKAETEKTAKKEPKKQKSAKNNDVETETTQASDAEVLSQQLATVNANVGVAKVRPKFTLKNFKWKVYAFFRHIYLKYLPESVHRWWRKTKQKHRK